MFVRSYHLTYHNSSFKVAFSEYNYIFIPIIVAHYNFVGPW